MSKYGIFTEENDSEYYFQIVKPSNGEKKKKLLPLKNWICVIPKFQIEGILKEGLGDLLIFIPFPF